MIPDSAQRGYLGAGRHAEARHRLASLAEPRATLAIAEQELKEATLRSPFHGGVTLRMAHPGEYLHVGDPVLAGVRTDRVRLRLEVPGRLASRVEPDQPLRFQLNGRVEHRGYGRRGHLLDRSPDNLLLHLIPISDREIHGNKPLKRLVPHISGWHRGRLGNALGRADLDFDRLAFSERQPLRRPKHAVFVGCHNGNGRNSWSSEKTSLLRF